MSYIYEARVVITGHDPAKAEAIRKAVNEVWTVEHAKSEDGNLLLDGLDNINAFGEEDAEGEPGPAFAEPDQNGEFDAEPFNLDEHEGDEQEEERAAARAIVNAVVGANGAKCHVSVKFLDWEGGPTFAY